MQRLHKFTRAAFLTVAVLAAGTVIPSSYSPFSAVEAQAATASNIVVRGNTRIEQETVLSYLTFQRGRSYSSYDVDESLKALYATGLFEDVKIASKGGTVYVTVSENPIINRVSFEGNKKIKDSALSSAVRSTPRSMMTRAKVQSDVQNILEAYRRSGRYDASVEPQVIDRGDNRVDLVFEISEGAKTGVERITFIGNHAFSDRRLRSAIRTRESGLLSWLRTTDTYDPDRLAADQELIRQYYYQRGYADFRIVSSTADLDREQNVFHVTFTVEEGEKYTISDVEVITSIAEVDPEALSSEVRTKSGQTFSSLKVEKTVEDLTVKIAENGYAFAQVRPRASRDYENKTISLAYYIEEGARAYIERINIIGNDRTREYVIRREFDFAEGDAFNRALMDKATRRLRNLGFFEKVNVTTSQGSAPDRVVVNVQVEEKSTGSVSFAIGYSTSEGVIGDISLSEKNFLGRGQYVKVSVGGGVDTRSFEFAFREPFFLGRRIALDLDVYKKLTKENDYRDYEQDKVGGGFGFTLPLREDELSVRLYYKIFNTKISDPDNVVTGLGNCAANADLSPAICDEIGSNLTSAAGYTLTYNTLDSNTNPHEGIYASFGQEYAGIGGDSYYLKTTAEARAYKEILPDYGIVGKLGVQGGHIMGIGSKRLRVSEQFMLGGDMVRGFETQGIGPRDTKSDDALGGTLFLAGTAEANFPFPFIPEEFGLSGAVFADAGAVWDADDDLENIVTSNGGIVASDSFSVRASTGLGVRWASPFGPISADFAWPLMKEGTDKTK
ncbi:MAG: outer membrane protein assembly factor BamA, partial [Rhodobacteraceae bacterium]|nr:outer membrane protein assembly factor BamA [Paracoccaceae bacterium]